MHSLPNDFSLHRQIREQGASRLRNAVRTSMRHTLSYPVWLLGHSHAPGVKVGPSCAGALLLQGLLRLARRSNPVNLQLNHANKLSRAQRMAFGHKNIIPPKRRVEAWVGGWTPPSTTSPNECPAAVGSYCCAAALAHTQKHGRKILFSSGPRLVVNFVFCHITPPSQSCPALQPPTTAVTTTLKVVRAEHPHTLKPQSIRP